jgi:hypothetical protein
VRTRSYGRKAECVSHEFKAPTSGVSVRVWPRRWVMGAKEGGCERVVTRSREMGVLSGAMSSKRRGRVDQRSRRVVSTQQSLSAVNQPCCTIFVAF